MSITVTETMTGVAPPTTQNRWFRPEARRVYAFQIERMDIDWITGISSIYFDSFFEMSPPGFRLLAPGRARTCNL